MRRRCGVARDVFINQLQRTLAVKDGALEANVSQELVRRVYGPFLKGRTIEGVAERLHQDRGVWIETDVLLEALVDNSREPIPPTVVDHLRRRLDGTARKKQGKARTARSAKQRLRDHRIAAEFVRYEAWLTARAHQGALRGWSALRSAEWWQGPPSERAARIVQKRLGLNLSWERIRAIAYERR